MQVLEAALNYITFGWHVFPVDGDKRPVLTGGASPTTDEPYRFRWGEYAASNQMQVNRLWTKYPDAGIALACVPSKLIVLDIDAKPGKPNGYRTLETIIRRLGYLDLNSVSEFTPSGGQHLIFAAGELHIKNSAGLLGAGLDIRGEGGGWGGYIVCAPTITPGGAYRWLEGAAPGECKLLPFPQELADIIAHAPKQKRTSGYSSNRQYPSNPSGE